MFKTANSFTETEILYFFVFFNKKESSKQHLFDIEIFCNFENVFTITFDQFIGSLLNKSIKNILLTLTFEW